MYNIWVLNLLAQPPRVVAHVTASEPETIVHVAGAMAAAFPGPAFTLVHEVNAKPLGLEG